MKNAEKRAVLVGTGASVLVEVLKDISEFINRRSHFYKQLP